MKFSVRSRLVSAIAGGVAALLSQVSLAGPIPACNLGEVTSSLYGDADACYGLVSGNINTSSNSQYYYGSVIPDAAFGGAFGGSEWTVIAEDDFETNGDGNFLSGGEWDVDLPAGTQEIIIVLKQATLWGAWYFNPADSSGTWTTSWQGNGTGFSHGFALVRKVPEPSTLALLGLGLLGVAAVRRRAATA